jgi:histidine kinase
VLASAGNLLKKKLESGSLDPALVAEVAREMVAQVDRCSRIINHLREFGRKSEVRRGKVDLREPIAGVFQLLGQQLRVHDIQVEANLTGGLSPVWGDANRLEQVFVNLVMNARDSIEERRKQDSRLEGRIQVSTADQNGQVVVTVSDNGCGVPEELIDRIFEPFFTTKDVGKGTGLGLSISYGIVRDYLGTITVRNNPDGGATFQVSLPVAREENP